MLDAFIYAEDAAAGSLLAGLLIAEGFEVETISHFSEAIAPCLQRSYRTAILSLDHARWPPRKQRLEVVRVLRQIDPDLPLIVICDEEGLEMERELREAGIFYFLTRPLSPVELLAVVKCAIDKSLRQSLETDY